MFPVTGLQHMTREAVMAVVAVNWSQLGTEAVVSTGLCALNILARAVSAFRGFAVSTRQLHDRAVGLGLLRCSGERHSPPPLTCQSASRLLLTGYRLPALVEPGG